GGVRRRRSRRTGIRHEHRRFGREPEALKAANKGRGTMFRARALMSLALGAVLALAAGEAAAQAGWPSRPIRFTVPLPPGGANDLLARVFAERLQTNLGQPVIVENKQGAGGDVGTASFATEPRSGCSLTVRSDTPHT